MIPLDLGNGVSLRWMAWAPDRKLNPQFAHLPDVPRYGAIVRHGLNGNACEAVNVFSGEVQRQLEPNRETWTVENWDPLTIHPSLQCACGVHGFIRDGKWVPA